MNLTTTHFVIPLMVSLLRTPKLVAIGLTNCICCARRTNAKDTDHVVWMSEKRKRKRNHLTTNMLAEHVCLNNFLFNFYLFK